MKLSECSFVRKKILSMRNSICFGLESKYLISITTAHSALINFDVYTLIVWDEGTYTDISGYFNVTIFNFSSTEVSTKLYKHEKAFYVEKGTKHRKKNLDELMYVLKQSNVLCTEFFLS
jgi:hypothetical protein